MAKDVKEVSGSDLSILGFASTEIDCNYKDLIFCSTCICTVFAPGKSSAVRTGVLGAVPDVRKAGGGEAVGQVSPVMKGWVRWPEGGVSAPAPGWCGISEGLL